MGIKDLGILENELLEKYGNVVGNSDLMHLLGFKSYSSFNRAVRMKFLEIDIFEIENRRGKFALTKDVAKWANDLKVRNQKKAKEEAN